MEDEKEVLQASIPPNQEDNDSQEYSRSYQEDLEKQSSPENTVSTASQAGGYGANGKEKDPNIVDWDGPDDPENPMNWSRRKKITAIVIVAVLAFLSYVRTFVWLVSAMPNCPMPRAFR